MDLHVKIKKKAGLASLLAAVLVSALLGTYIFALDNVAPGDISFISTYRSITVSWPAATGAKLYAVYSADDALGTNARRIAIVDAPSYTDTLLRPGQTRSYAVQSGTGRDDLDSVDLSTLSWSAVQEVPVIGAQVAPGDDPILSPHRGPDYIATSKDGCTRCHLTHDATNHTLIVSSGTSDHSNVAVAICADCHEQTTSAEKAFVGSVFADSGSLSGHRVDSAALNDGKLECITCHGPHQDSAQADNALKPSTTIKKFGTLTADLAVDPNRSNNQCTTCHDDAQTWYTATNTSPYPETRVLASESSIPAGDIPEGYASYPVEGTYPGATVSADSTKNVHAKILASEGYNKGDCRYCHTSHASSAPFDGLLTERGELRAMKGSTPEAIEAERVSGAYASFCLSCHNGSNKGTAWSAAANIADKVSVPVGSLEASRVAFLASAAGHVVRSPLATIPEGSAMPCYSCHDIHGNAAGNAKNLSATLATGITEAMLDREFCLTCHATSDGKILNATASGYESVGSQKVLGLSRAGMDSPEGGGSSVANGLRLPMDIPEHSSSTSQPCSTCHGDIHNPVASTSTLDRKNCLECHTQKFPAAAGLDFVDNGSGEAVGYESGYNPHLVPGFSKSMGANFFPENILSGTPAPFTPIPQITNATKPYCSGCHAWCLNEAGSLPGLELGRDKGASLRENYNSPTPAKTDYIHSAANPKLGGLCLSCHNNYLGAKDVGAPTKGPINARNELDSEGYFESGHNYSVSIQRLASSDTESSTITKTFDANCTKCHNSSDSIFEPLENADKLRLTGHYRSGRRLLARYGILADIAKPSTHTNPATKKQEDFNNKGMCFGCHARAGEIAGNAGKKYPGMDWYGKEPVKTSYQTTWKNASGTIIGTQTFNSESVLDDMYITKSAGGAVQSFQPGDGAGDAADKDAKNALKAKHEFSGHQVTLDIDINRQSGDGSSPDRFALRGYVRRNMTSMRCSDCHNVHSSSKASMGTYTEWPTTKKPRVTSAISTNFVDSTTPAAAVGKDGSRLITLNDYWTRDEVARWGLEARISDWLRDVKGISDAAKRKEMFEEMEYNGISVDLLKQINDDYQYWDPFPQNIINLWGSTVDIFCFRCHAYSTRDNKMHKVASHQKKAIACVNCHVPQVHGSKMDFLLGDRGSIPGIDGRASGVVAAGHSPMQPHQIFKWTDYSHIQPSSQTILPEKLNQPTLKLLRYKTADIGAEDWKTSRGSCSTAAGCHGATAGSDAIEAGWSNWVGQD